MSDPSYTNLNMSEQWFFKEAIMIVIPLFETRVLKDQESVVILIVVAVVQHPLV